MDLVDENSAVLIGEWETEAALANHLRSRDCTILFGAISTLATPANIGFKRLSCICRNRESADSAIPIESEKE